MERANSTKKPIVQPLLAASILLVRDSANGLEVLMMERAKTMRFAPGAFVFPGGKIDPADGDEDAWQGVTNTPTQTEDTACRIGVLRELYEEAAIALTVEPCKLDALEADFCTAIKAVGACLDVAGLIPLRTG